MTVLLEQGVKFGINLSNSRLFTSREKQLLTVEQYTACSCMSPLETLQRNDIIVFTAMQAAKSTHLTYVCSMDTTEENNLFIKTSSKGWKDGGFLGVI